MKRVAAAVSIVVASAIAAFGVVDHGGVSAADSAYPPRDLVLTLSDDTLDPGATFEATVSGCAGGEVIDFEFEGSETRVECVGGSGRSFSTPSGNEATQQFVAPLEAGTFVGSATVASTGAPVGAFEIEVVLAADVVDAVDRTFVGQLDGGVSWLFLLLIVVATILATVAVRVRLLAE